MEWTSHTTYWLSIINIFHTWSILVCLQFVVYPDHYWLPIIRYFYENRLFFTNRTMGITAPYHLSCPLFHIYMHLWICIFLVTTFITFTITSISVIKLSQATLHYHHCWFVVIVNSQVLIIQSTSLPINNSLITELTAMIRWKYLSCLS